MGSTINVHPFVTHAYVHVPEAPVRAALELWLESPEMDFVRDNDLWTDWAVSDYVLSCRRCEAPALVCRVRGDLETIFCLHHNAILQVQDGPCAQESSLNGLGPLRSSAFKLGVVRGSGCAFCHALLQ